jgi:hypothetical protein
MLCGVFENFKSQSFDTNMVLIDGICEFTNQTKQFYGNAYIGNMNCHPLLVPCENIIPKHMSINMGFFKI